MKKTTYKKLSYAPLLLFCATFSHTALTTQFKPSNGVSLHSIMDVVLKSHDLLIAQVGDTAKEYWVLAGNNAAQTWAQFVGNNPIPAFIPGTDGELNKVQTLLASLNSNSFNFSHGIAAAGSSDNFLPQLIEEYRLANFTPPGQPRSLRASDPIDAIDHNETGDDVSKPLHEFVASEDLRIPSGGGDDNNNNPLPYTIPIDHPDVLSFPNGDPDFKVIAFEPGNALVGLQTVPEPGTLALMGLGLAGFGFIRRRKLIRRS